MATLSTTVQNYRTDGGGWYANGTGASSGKWGATNGTSGYGPRCFVTRYAFSIPAGKTYRLTTFTWSTGTNYFKYYDGGWGTNLTPRFVIAKSTYESTIQVGDYDGGGIKALKTFASGSTKTAAWTSTSSTKGVAPNQTGKSISISNAGSQAATYYLYIYGPDTDYGYSDCKGTLTITYVDESYTACTAPTSVTASGIITPSGSFTVSWSGAKAGTNNPISGYTVYWRISSGGSAPTTSTYNGYYTVGSSISSYQFQLSSATRGYKIVCGVVTLASAGAAYNSSIKTGGLVTINSLPAAPGLDKNSQTISSTAAAVSVTATAGADTNTSQTRTVYYSTTSTGTKTKYTSAISINPTAGSSLTRWFYTWDGLEYSSPTTITITRNNASSLSVDYDKDSYVYGSSGTGYDIPNKLKITATKSNAGTNSSVKISIKYNASGSTSPLTEYVVKASQAITSGQRTDVTINPQTLMTQFYNSGANLNYQIAVTYNDGYESAKTVTLPSSGYFLIPAAPSITAIYNQHASEDKDGTTSRRLCRQGRIEFYDDTAMTISSITVNDGSNFNATIDAQGPLANHKKYLDFTFDRLPTSGSLLTFTVIISNSASTLTKSFSPVISDPEDQYYAIKMPVFELPNTTNPILYPFGTPTIATDTIVWPFGTNESLSAAATEYQFDLSNLTFVFCGENSDTNTKVVSGQFIKDLDKLSFTYAAASHTNYSNGVIAFDRASSNTDNTVYGIASYSGTSIVRSRIQLTNLYGEVFTQYFTHTIDFNHQVSNPSADYGVYYNDSYEQVYYQQGLTLKVTNISFQYYTEGSYSYILEGARTKTPTESDWIEIKRDSLASLSNTNQNGTTYVQPSNLSITYSIGEVADTYPRTFRIKVYTGNSTPGVDQTPTSFEVIKQVAPTMTYDGFGVDRQESGTPITYTYKYTLENPQLSDIYATSDSSTLTSTSSFSYVCDERSATGSVHSQLTLSGTDYVTSYNTEPLWERAVRYIQVSTSVTNQPKVVGGTAYTSTQTYFLGGYTVIFISPLVAYRVQQLGINTKTVASGVTLDIHVGAGDCIRLQGSANTMVIDMNLGLISYYNNLTATDASSTTDLVHQIDLANGVIN